MITKPVEWNVGNIIQINITGKSKHDLSLSIFQSLAVSSMELIDVTLYDSPEAFNFTALVELSEDDPESPALDKLLFLCTEEKLQCSYHPVIFRKLEKEYDNRNENTALVLGKQLSTSTIVDIIQFFQDKKIELKVIQCLSVLASASHEAFPACIEIALKESSSDWVLLKKQALEFFASKKDLDLILRSNAEMDKDYRLAAFDMDSTLIQAEVIDLLADAAGVGKQVAEVTEQAMQGKLDFDESFRHRLGLLKGLDESVLKEIAEELPIMDGAERLLKILKTLGYKTAIISGGFVYFAQYLQRKLGVDYVYANELEIINGKVTGCTKGEIINGDRKAALLRQLAFREDIELDQVLAVGDGANDLPMLGEAGLGVAYKAKPLVQERAKFSITSVGLDGLLFLLGENDLEQLSLL